jgi:predicted amidohydrolase
MSRDTSSSHNGQGAGLPRDGQAARTVKIAAVQPALRVGAVEDNLIHLEDLIRAAVREHQPAVVIVPEAVTSPSVYTPQMATVARPIDGAPMALFRQLARELDVVVGGGFAAHRGRDVRGTYALAEPDGRVHLHDKDMPTMWENHYYRGGSDPGRIRVSTLAGSPVGMACGWEWARMATARRLQYRVQLLVGGMCWPSYPNNWPPPLRWWMRHEHIRQLQHARELPVQMARLLGAPVAIASHVGPVSFDTPLASSVRWRTDLIGGTQIVERDGSVLARLGPDDGEGHISAEVRLARPQPLDPVSELDWIPPLSPTTRAAWRVLNVHGATSYRIKRLLRLHPWQSWPSADLPNEIDPGDPGEQQVASSGRERDLARRVRG